MQPIVPLWLIYFSGICDDLKSFFIIVGGFGLAMLLLSAMFHAMEEFELIPKFKRNLVICMTFVFIGVLVPSQRTVYTLMIGSQITPNNIQLVGGTLKSTVDYMFEKTTELIKETKDK